MSRARQFFVGGVRVPFIAQWAGETPTVGLIVMRRGIGGGIAYADEYWADRNSDVLWVRAPSARGRGEAYLGKVHPLRQRQAMLRMLCQVCGLPTADDEERLFLVRDTGGKPIVEGEKTASPPVHEECAQETVRDCPHLRQGHTAARVKYPRAWGVAGIVYDPQRLAPLPGDAPDGLTFVGYDDPRIRWTLAAREVVTLEGCTAYELPTPVGDVR